MQHYSGSPYGAHSLHCGTPCIEQTSPPWGGSLLFTAYASPLVDIAKRHEINQNLDPVELNLANRQLCHVMKVYSGTL